MLEKLKRRLGGASDEPAGDGAGPAAAQAAAPIGEQPGRGQTAAHAPADDAGMPPSQEWPVEP